MLNILGMLSVLGATIMGMHLAKEAGWRIRAQTLAFGWLA
jgi:hypothetical protein